MTSVYNTHGVQYFMSRSHWGKRNINIIYECQIIVIKSQRIVKIKSKTTKYLF
jgi:hypothetical protein